MLVESYYRGHRIEVRAVPVNGRWDRVRIHRAVSDDKPYVETVTCRKMTAELAELVRQSTLDDGSASTALTSVADDPAVRARTQERLRKGLLPAARPRRIWAGQEADELCSVCDMVIGFGDILCEWLVDDGHQARMYPMCYDAFIAGMDSHCAA